MHNDRRSVSPFYPLMLALALVVGLFIGNDMGSGGVSMNLLGKRDTSPSEKIGRVLDLIDKQYVDTVQKNVLVDEVLQDLLQRLDPHSYYISAAELRAAQEPLEGSFDGIGIEFAIQRDTVVVVTPVEGGPSEALGIRPGDRIMAANGTPMTGTGITNDQVMKLLRGPKGSEVIVSFLRNGRGEPFDVNIKRGKIPINSVAVSLYSEDGTGYIKLVRFAKNTHQEFMDAVQQLRKQGMQRLVLDLRGNGGGYLNAAIDLADEFLPAGRTIVYTQGRTSPRQDIQATRRGSLEELPLAVLIDESSASASEIIAGAVQDNDRGLIVGRRSFGKGLVQEHMELPDASAVRLTTARYYTPSGRSIQRPYGSGINYQDEFDERYESGEMLSADKMNVDSSQVYHTLAGREVFGGGGVMPDIFVPTDTSEGSHYLSELFFSGTLNQFAFDVADRQRTTFLGYGSPRAFKERFQVGEEMMRELGKYAGTQGIQERPVDVQRSRGQISNRLKAGIARNLWGNAGYYEIMLGSDTIYERARKELNTGG